MDFALPVDHQVNVEENKKRHKHLDLVRKLKKALEHEGDSDTNSNWSTQNDPHGLGKGARRVGNIRLSGDHPNYSSVKSDQNTK